MPSSQTDHAPPGARRAGAVPPAAAARPPRAPSPDEPRHARGRDTLPANDFLQHLRRETRRSMRSAGPLSIALYRLTGDGAGAGLDDAHVLEMLHMAKRETDILGHLGDDVLAVLCPDTGQDGIRAFVRKIGLCGAPGSALDVVAATFPDPVFERLLEPGAGWPARRPGDGLAAAPVAPRDGYLGKRALDVAGALVALALVWPVMLVVAILVAASSPGPVIFRQTRLGRGARPFVFYKFRSMTADAADDAHRSFATRFVRGAMDGPAAAGAAPFKLARDPRVTRIGAFLRRSSLDELPQFFNVLRGDMSLVGPRPPIPYEVECYQPWHLRRILGTRPGITGLWQVEGRSRVTFDAMVRMDLRYIRECSLLLDLKILARTVLVVLRADGAA